jgi:hypothetical protein
MTTKTTYYYYYSHFFSFSFKREKRCAYSATLIMKE